jgi:hypothetical protein
MMLIELQIRQYPEGPNPPFVRVQSCIRTLRCIRALRGYSMMQNSIKQMIFKKQHLLTFRIEKVIEFAYFEYVF